jgi:hypothetical protein
MKASRTPTVMAFFLLLKRSVIRYAKYIVSSDALLDRITPDCDEIDDSIDPWGEIRPNETSESKDRIPDANLHGSAEF